VLAVGFEVEQVVDDVGGGGAEAEAEEGDDRSGEQTGGPGVGEEERKKDEEIFGPLVDADGFEPGFEGVGLLGEGADGGDSRGAEGGAEAGGGICDHGLLAGLEEGQVGQGVADVGEAVSEAGLEGEELVVAGEVGFAVGGEDAGEETEVVGDTLGEDGVGGGGEVDGAAGGVLLLEVLEEFAVVGEVGYIELDGCGEVLLEGGFALEEPAGQVQERGGIVAGEDEGGVDEGVRLDEGSVEVDAEHGEDGVGGSVGRGNRDGQKCVLLFAGLGLSLVFWEPGLI
jgi:hypothetical protein